MKFAIIDPTARTVECIDDDRDVAVHYARAGLTPGKVDHGVLKVLRDGGGIGMVVAEFGLYMPPAKQHYFAIGKLLIAGGAVLYQYARGGDTVDLEGPLPTVRWFLSQNDIEHEIAAGTLLRPVFRINGQIVWAWPEPAPPGLVDGK